MKEVKLTEKNYSDIKSSSVTPYVNSYARDENGLVKAVINSFIAFCNYHGYIVKDGKVFTSDEKEEKSNKTI